MVGLNPAVWESLERGRSFVAAHRFGFSNLWDGSSRSLSHYAVTATPSKRLLDGHGNEIEAWRGAMANFDEVEDLLDSLE